LNVFRCVIRPVSRPRAFAVIKRMAGWTVLHARTCVKLARREQTYSFATTIDSGVTEGGETALVGWQAAELEPRF